MSSFLTTSCKPYCGMEAVWAELKERKKQTQISHRTNHILALKTYCGVGACCLDRHCHCHRVFTHPFFYNVQGPAQVLDYSWPSDMLPEDAVQLPIYN